MIGVIDYGAGNTGSVMNALERLGAPARFARGPEELARDAPFDKILFPGDGHFGTTMASLESAGYTEALREWIRADRPFLGICIGLQALFENSEEAPGVPGLGVIRGTVKRFPGRKTPQIGWNSTRVISTAAGAGGRLFRGVPDNSFFYYIHSYYAACGERDAVTATAEYYLEYCSAVERGNCAAVQFHPEKSGAAGLVLLENWLRFF
ncbi:MAG: imidazole glycerol phosphate synthase subunit HisH [Spirochaetaceae bacterium]|nr:imidazole glycerol phosphate synthase subunit HisH [Spirochaetaceae bacterium]